MQPDQFFFDEHDSATNPFIHLLYQIKGFLHSRNFNAVSYLKELRAKIEATLYSEEARWDIVRVTIFIAFLLKDQNEC
jgi:hypothetical protein